MLVELPITVALGTLVALTTIAAVHQADAAVAQSDKVCTPEALAGTYVIESGEKYGTKEPEDRIKGTVVTFTKDALLVEDKDKKELYSAFYTLKSTSNPSDIVMTSRVKSTSGEVARGLIQKDGDTVRLIYAIPDGEIPTGFKTKEKQLMFVMKKSK